ncbi:peptide ABC transporter substrate-binding protein [Desulfococcaceae bacterium HSG8]|nr:peptide ABC transporter substrate-binding protein [Desulfococcaceae bacterium HSG8]
MTTGKNFIVSARTIVAMACILFLMPQFAAAEGKLNVGFTTEMAIDNLVCGEDWQYSEMGAMLWPLIYDQLWAIGPAPEYKPVPRLATGWETKDNKTWTFHLNKNSKFHDGKPVTAKDVAFTLEYLPKSSPSWLIPDKDCESIEVTDDHTLRFTLKKKHGGTYPPAFWFPILPAHIWEPHKDDMLSFKNEKAVGSGPFKLKAFKPEQYAWFEAYKDYYGEKAGMDEVVFKCYGSEDAMIMAMKNDEIDMFGYNGCPVLASDEFKQNKRYRINVSPGIEIAWLIFNLHKETPLLDLNLRKAIMHGIDVKKIKMMIYRGYAQPADSFIYTELPGYNPNLPPYNYDPATAMKILDDAGYKDTDKDEIRNDPKTGKNLSFEFMVPSDWSDKVKTVSLIKELLKKVGIDISMKVVDLDTYYDFSYAPKDDKFDITIGAEEPGPNANWVWEFCRSYEGGGEGWNSAYYNNPGFDALLDKMLAEADMTKRNNYLRQMQKIIAHDLPYGFLFRRDVIDPLKTDKFEGFVPTMGGVSTWINPWTYFKVRVKK